MHQSSLVYVEWPYIICRSSLENSTGYIHILVVNKVQSLPNTYWLLHVLRAVLRLLLETRGHEAPEGECSKQSNTAWRACSK